jgi:membrane-associated phospholipid phosphatase
MTDLTLIDGAAQSDAPTNPEITALRQVQRVVNGQAGTGAVRAARALSFFGEHALGWLAIGALGAAIDKRRRREWLIAAGGVAVAHGASIAVKRVVRRPRPDHPDVQVLVGTPSKLSFPSSHAASTTAAAVLYGGLTGQPAAGAVVPPMLLSRMVLGVHYPSDVLAGSVLGGVIGAAALRFARRIGTSARKAKP